MATEETKDNIDTTNRSLFNNTITTNTSYNTSTKRRKSKLKQRRLKSKMESKKLKNEQTRNLKKAKESNKISTNEMYKECIPLSQEETNLINTEISKADIKELAISPDLGKESDDGYIEYKWKLVCPDPDRIQHLVTQMRYRLTEGNGKCIYQIGIEDNGNPKGLNDQELIETIKTIFRLNKQLNGQIQITSIKKGINGKVATLGVINENILPKQSNDEYKQQ